MINRRSFIIGTASFTLGNLLAGCAAQTRSTLNVRMLNGSVPPQVLNEFRRYLKKSRTDFVDSVLNFSSEAQLQSIFSLLQTWKQQSSQTASASKGLLGWVPFLDNSKKLMPADLVTLGDYWLGKAIQQELIQPFDPSHLQEFNRLVKSSFWKTLMTRNDEGQPDPDGQVWAVPYRWGSTVIAYRQDIFKEKGLTFPTDWNDLWRPDLRRHISLLDQPREVIGLTLKKLGKSYNTNNLSTVPNLESELAALRSQVKLYSSDTYLQPLLLGDTWLAVGWSTDVLPLMQRSKTIAAIVPRSGTALWADLWVRPAMHANEMPPLVTEWLQFCWQPEIANELSLLSQAASPIILTEDATKLPSELRSNPLLYPDPKTLKASEFLYPLPESTIGQYQEYWKRLRQVG